eukprot:TRINITY_DN375_c0_g1_i2.p1 TRINITY_DN375_c0_g1~~TRINITY_DN375_c0_g1_i2.p1  ORF type:complete len:145 (+),score=50.91 TRINITY_DN375_c0_g1_i2:27-461(+)
MVYLLCIFCVIVLFFFFLMIRRPPRSTLSSSSAASDVYKRQVLDQLKEEVGAVEPYLAAVKIMRVLCRNLLAHRSDTKYRRIDLSNQRLHDTCTKFEQARAVLISAGFEPDVEDDGTRVLVVSSVNEDKLMRLVHLFDEELEQA